MSTEPRKVPANQPSDRTYTNTWKGNCVPFGHGTWPNEEAALAGARSWVAMMPTKDREKEIILTMIR